MALGDTKKDGVIMKCESGFQYYHGNNDDGLRPLMKEGNLAHHRVKTIKVYEMVEIANNYVSVRIYPDGRVEVIPSE